MLGLLAEPDRLRVAAAMVLGSHTVEAIVRATGLEPKVVEQALARLTSGGLVTGDRSSLTFDEGELRAAVRSAAEEREAGEKLGLPPVASDVLRRFIRNGRLVSIPMARSKRLVILDHLSQEFEPGWRYTEADVNQILGDYHEDVAALRRYLVDEGFMAREAGEYWRTGGSFTP
ncbi:MAG TPA: DUF2087 domain-containing protein [Actinomycetota bacterium]|nr:DUF2087 domain-containing protein [Actinomycetota bacterium]